MGKSRKRIAAGAAIALALTAVSLTAAMTASARDGHGRDDGDRDRQAAAAIFRSSLAPSVPSDPAIHGVAAGGAPWVIDRGRVVVRADGRIEATIRGLVIPVAHGTFPAGTPRPVNVVSASLYCAPDTSAAVATTPAVPISDEGDATISARVALPATCLAPIVLVNPNQAAGVYIAASGWRG